VDRRQFQRLLQNLIGNAIKFRSDRPLQITLRSQRVRDEWRIGIKDNGIGISEEDSKRIFDMFERVSSEEDQPGTGMGLAICKRIVQNHGGRIWVRSTPGAGSVFIFSVPQTGEPRATRAEWIRR
jgi:chemotaxis family two-component system sensor kinase Cph1